MRKNRKGQSTLEYALTVTVVIAALLAINVFMKRGVQGRLKESTDDVGQQFDGRRNYTYAWRSAGNSTVDSVIRETRNTTQDAIISNIVQAKRLPGEFEGFGNYDDTALPKYSNE